MGFFYMNMNTKQVIVIRRDLKCRRGKEIAQGSHASMAFITRQFQNRNWFLALFGLFRLKFTKAMWEWFLNSFAKVCVQVDTEEELLEIDRLAREAGLECHLITDSGRTEFNGVPTRTCLAIGPDYSDKIDKITGHLKLY